MTSVANRYHIVLGLLVFLALYLVLFFWPVLKSTDLVGFSGFVDGSEFVIDRVVPGSPADRSGIREADILRAQADRSVLSWRSLFDDQFSAYLDERRELRGTVISHEMVRDGESLSVDVAARPLGVGQSLAQYGIRGLFVLFLVSLCLLIIASRTRDWCAFLVCLSFCCTGFWLFSGARYWPVFLAPALPGADPGAVPVTLLVEVLSLQLLASLLLHLALVFPRRHAVLRTLPKLTILLYALPLVVLAAVVLMGEGSLVNRVKHIYPVRLGLNSVALVLVTGLMLYSYRTSDTPLERERTRWVVGSIAVSAACVIVLWNLPHLVLGRPLVPDFDWLLLPLALVPLSLTAAINNHHLLGIRGLVRRRLRALEQDLVREKTNVVTRDRKLQQLAREINDLKRELHTYSEAERVDAPRSAAETTALQRLESRHPALSEIRRDRLLGASPLWEQVFKEIAVAAQGTTPVLIVGESGTGKTDVAWSIYRLGERVGQPFREVSCAQFEHADPAIPLGRLFGIGRSHGLANVPREGQRGLFQECDGGTLFLDDFDRLPPNVQDLLLYPLEGKAFEPGIGTGAPVQASIKFILATNQDPERLVAQGGLRGDVVARLGARVHIPPLRDRSEDIPVLVEHFLSEIGREIGHDVSVVSSRTLHLLAQRPYRGGNARELRSELRMAVGKAMLEDDHVLRAGYLSAAYQPADPATVLPDSGGPVPSPEPGRVDAAGSSSSTSPQPGSATGAPNELAVLRRHRFQIKPSEAELGFSHKSKTLSNHLRGICIKAYMDSHWDAARAARAVAGSGDSRLVAALQRKIERYAARIHEHVAAGTQQRLYNNLPATYHPALDAAIGWSRQRANSG